MVTERTMPEGERAAEDELLEKYRSAGRCSGGELLLRLPDALRFLDDCEKHGLAILGLDFYAVSADAVAEVGSTEWSSITQGPGAARSSQNEARALLAGGLPDGAEFVSFVLEERSG